MNCTHWHDEIVSWAGRVVKWMKWRVDRLIHAALDLVQWTRMNILYSSRAGNPCTILTLGWAASTPWDARCANTTRREILSFIVKNGLLCHLDESITTAQNWCCTGNFFVRLFYCPNWSEILFTHRKKCDLDHIEHYKKVRLLWQVKGYCKPGWRRYDYSGGSLWQQSSVA